MADMAHENLSRMEVWKAKVGRILARPLDSDSSFSSELKESYARADFSRMSNWAIICEEILDTEFPSVYFKRAREELRCRGLSVAKIEEMRCFAWLTAGWLNFEMMLWEWGSLDASDIQWAIEWQFRDGWITEDERDQLTAFAFRYEGESKDE